MTKNKLKRFEDMSVYSNVITPKFDEVFRSDFRLKERWAGSVFGNNNPIVLELGCGKGEYTVAMARKYPKKNFIGVDIKGARMWVGATDALQSKLTNAAFLRARIEFITACFACNEISEIWITFPDPQIKHSRENRRLTSPRFIKSYSEILQPKGIIHLKTDSKDLFDYTCKIVESNNYQILERTDDLYNSNIDDDVLSVQTYYEKKFTEQGLSIKYLKFRL